MFIHEIHLSILILYNVKIGIKNNLLNNLDMGESNKLQVLILNYSEHNLQLYKSELSQYEDVVL